MNIKIIGMDELNKKLANIPKFAVEATHDELKKVALDLQGKSQELAPVDQGDLKGSAFTEVEGLNATIGFSEIYALRQHEGMEYKHPKGGEAKFMEKPYKQNVNKYIDMIGNAVKRRIDK